MALDSCPRVPLEVKFSRWGEVPVLVAPEQDSSTPEEQTPRGAIRGSLNSVGPPLTGKKAEIERVIAPVLTSSCKRDYERLLADDLMLRGSIVVRFTIDREGFVGGTRTRKNTVGDAQLASCLSSELSGLVFPTHRGAGPVAIVYEFYFVYDGPIYIADPL